MEEVIRVNTSWSVAGASMICQDWEDKHLDKGLRILGNKFYGLFSLTGERAFFTIGE